MKEIRHVNLESEDLVADRIEQLKDLFPEVVTEGDGSIDFEKLRLILGDEVDEGDERYAFTWPGKTDAIRQAQTVSAATLRPCPEKSVNWDTTQNLYIEGDNLEVLKLLQRCYHGKVKMIYIDPPYNTGHDFVYHDTFGDSIENYREQAGLSGQSNADTSGRYHSNWCSMMYPRLKLARELLSDDGVLIVSISDSELKNLKSLLDEIFGEPNFCGDILWNSTKSVTNTALISVSHTYNLVYFKNMSYFTQHRYEFRLKDDGDGFSNPDNDPLGPWKADPFQVGGWRPNQQYEIVNPNTGIAYRPNPGCSWKNDYSNYLKLVEQGRIIFGRTGEGGPQRKRYLFEAEDRGKVSKTWWDDVESTSNGTQTVKKLFDGITVFDNPKPVSLIEKFLQLASSSDSIVLDFFSGSSTTAHAVMKANCEDGGARRYIAVQLPESCAPDSQAFAAGYRNICDLGEERIRRAGKKIAEEVEEANRQLKIGEEPKEVPDIGFRVLKLDDSGIARPEPGQLMLDRIKSDRTDEDIIFEMMLKWGLELTYPIEKTEIGDYPCYSVAGDALICCMHEGLTVEAIQAIADRLPSRVLMFDSILDDTLKLNAVQIFKHVEEKNQITIDLRTV